MSPSESAVVSSGTSARPQGPQGSQESQEQDQQGPQGPQVQQGLQRQAGAERSGRGSGSRASSSASLLLPPPRPRPPPHGRPKHCVHWFRKGLRLHDNPSLLAGLRGSTTLRCIFVLDPWFAGSSNVGINKWRFLLQCLEDLDNSLRKFNSRLFVIRGQPADALPKLFKGWGTTYLTFEEDPEPFGRVRDQNIIALCKGLNIKVVSRVSHTLYRLERIIEKNGGKAPLTYHQFQNVIASMDQPSPAEPTITAEHMQGCSTPIAEDHDEKYGVPTLEELGFETEGLKPAVWMGGETEALARLEHHLERKAWVASFGRPKMTPQSLLPSQTGLSPYLRFGCLSTRLFYYQLTDLYKKIKKAVPPLSLHGQLLWREFFYCAATCNPNFDKMDGNPICVQIPWDRNPEAIAKWANGQTGFPWIDAIMTQLREEGWIHHLARHAVACFLTRGDLWVSWEEGMKVFEEFLLDADWSVNAGMWMWLSCSSFFQQFFHCYCPVRFGRKADPNGDYIRRYMPALKNFPTKYIHEPWNAPEEIQRSAKCIIGKDYPKPMVNHGTASRINLERMKQVYAQLSKYRGSGLLATVPSSMSLYSSVQNKSSSISEEIPHESASVGNQIHGSEKQESRLFQKISSSCLQQDEQHPQSQHHRKSQQETEQSQHHGQQQQQQGKTSKQYTHHQRQNLSYHRHFRQHQQNFPTSRHAEHRTQQFQPQSMHDPERDLQLMGPPKSVYRTSHSQRSQVVVSEQQIQCINTDQFLQLQPSTLHLETQQIMPLYVHVEQNSYHNSVQNMIPNQSQPYQHDLQQQDFSLQQTHQEEQHQWTKNDMWNMKSEHNEVACSGEPGTNTSDHNCSVSHNCTGKLDTDH